MESLGVTVPPDFWPGKRVLITGHTGFKGSWLALWLQQAGANVTGFALPPPSSPSLFELARVRDVISHVEADIRTPGSIGDAARNTAPDIVFHLAAQSLVRPSYEDPTGTFATNVMGTVHLLDAVRATPSVRAVVIVTSDKCYDNREWVWGYRETDPMGGYDPYSASKGCAELVTASYRQAFFSTRDRRIGIASARAGNVIGGGDWARDRLIPDAVRAFERAEAVVVRNPTATRPWQHVLEPLAGYMMLARALWEQPGEYSEGWNFGPDDSGTQSVASVIDAMATAWGEGVGWRSHDAEEPHEAMSLRLDCSKAKARLRWRPRLALATALEWTARWYRDVGRGSIARDVTLSQIKAYEELA